MVLFNSLGDRDEVLYSGSHTMNNKPIILKVWTTEFDFTQEGLTTVPLWVRFSNLPLHCWSRGSLSRIGSALGNLLFADECTTKVKRISYARMLIEMNVTQPLPKEIFVQIPSGKVFLQALAYDWMPAYCTECLMVGHRC